MKKQILLLISVFWLILLVAGCRATEPGETETPTISVTPEENNFMGWFDVPMTDVQTGETFKVSDFSGKVVLLETMAMWCPNCIVQANEVRNLHQMLENPEDLVSISLDVDVHEDAESLKEYTEEYGFEWRFAIAPLAVARTLGNLYSAQYLNPPLSPMLLIDRNGDVYQFPYGKKKADDLLSLIQPFLDQE